jgi:hypothetical protein
MPSDLLFDHEPLSEHLLPFSAIISRKVIVPQNTLSSTVKDVS